MRGLWRNIYKIALFGAALFAPISASYCAMPSREELVEMERKAQAQKIEHKRLQAKSVEINLEMNKLNKSLISAAKKIQQNEKNLSRMENELETIKGELAASEAKFNEENKQLANTLAALQNLAQKPAEALFVQPLTPVEVIRSAILLRETVPYISENTENLKKQLETITEQKKQIEQRVESIKKEQKTLAAEQQNLNVLMKKKKSMRSDLENKTAISRKKSEKLASQAKDLRELVAKIEQQQKIKKQKQREEKLRLEKERELARRQQELASYSRDKSDDLIINNQDTINDIGNSFVKAKGLLSRPAAGPVITAYGQETAKGVSSKGIVIKTRTLAQVVAPFDGAVVFAGPFKGYGNMVIIEHGKGYLSLLAGLDNFDCEIGQMLLAGEPLGQMPNSKEAKLYMEIRKDSHPVNPEIWLAK